MENSAVFFVFFFLTGFSSLSTQGLALILRLSLSFSLCLVKANTFWRRGGGSEDGLKSCTVSCFHGCSLSHMCALSLQLMALFTGFLAPPPPPLPPPTCTSETAALEPRRSLLPLWTSKLCPFCTGAATLWTIVHTHTHTHTHTWITFAQNTHRHETFCFYRRCRSVFPLRLFFFISAERWDILDLKLDVGWSSLPVRELGKHSCAPTHIKHTQIA